MAITRAKQARQMYKRGTFGGNKGPQGPAGGASAGGNYGGNRNPSQDYGGGSGDRDDIREQYSVASTTGTSPKSIRPPVDKTGPGTAQQSVIDLLDKFKKKRSKVNVPGFFGRFLKKPIQKFADFTAAKNRPFFEEVIRAGKIPGLNFATVANMTEEELEEAYQNYNRARLSGEIDAFGNPLNQGDDSPPPLFPLTGIMTQAPEEDEEPEYVNPLSKLTARIAGSQFAADGGRIGAQEGGIMPRLNQLGSGVSSAEQMLQEINQRLESAESSLGGSNGNQFSQVTLPATLIQAQRPPSLDKIAPGFKTGQPTAQLSGSIQNQQNKQDVVDLEQLYPNAGQNQISNFTPMRGGAEMMELAGIPAAGYADGGRITSLEDMDREGFVLGGIAKGLKKAVRGIKKLAKSPIGKAALAYAAFQYGGGKSFLFGAKGPPGVAKTGMLQKLFLKNPSLGFSLSNISPTAGIFAASAAAGAMTPKEDKNKFDLDSYYASGQLDPSQSTRMMGSDFDFYGGQRIASAEGGSTDKEPVAKKTMPLLDMGGKEMDLREDGGFVPIGRMEKADDVPARLSKNEFVFTADAVRNAGDGDVDKGAEVMYNMMKNLEAGGEVSEESQGLEGARKMFQTSQRLEEVL